MTSDADSLGEKSYYAEKLSATHLKQVYDLASESVRRYLAAEIAHVKACIPPSGRVLFSRYAEAFWDHRLAWFRLQACEGLLGEIDEAATGRGVIVCKDEFRTTTVAPDQFRWLSRGLGRQVTVAIVADASVFCEILV